MISKIVILTLNCLFICSAIADPDWLKPNMTETDCKDVDWKYKSLCLEEVHSQELAKVNSYLDHEFKLIDKESCIGITKKYKEKEKAWANYIASECSFKEYCTGNFCGTGENVANNDCSAKVTSEESERAHELLHEGFETRGCSFSPNAKSRVFETDKFKITLKALCPEGRYGCRNIKYIGQNKKNKQKIELIGKELLKTFDYTKSKILGYEFKNKNVTYHVLFSGFLIIKDTDKNKILGKEKGLWKFK